MDSGTYSFLQESQKAARSFGSNRKTHEFEFFINHKLPRDGIVQDRGRNVIRLNELTDDNLLTGLLRS